MAATLALPTGRAGRLLALVLAGLALLAVWAVLAQPLLGWYRDRAGRLAERRLLLARMTGLAAELPALRHAAQAASGAAQAALVPIAGGSDAIAGASLQEQVQHMAAQAGATVSSIETLPATEAGPYRRIGVRVAASGSWPVLVRLLAAIRQARPSMVADDLNVQSPQLPTSAPVLPLTAGFSVLAFRAASGAPGAAK
jgi:general secretion pathway protein M